MVVPVVDDVSFEFHAFVLGNQEIHEFFVQEEEVAGLEIFTQNLVESVFVVVSLEKRQLRARFLGNHVAVHGRKLLIRWTFAQILEVLLLPSRGKQTNLLAGAQNLQGVRKLVFFVELLLFLQEHAAFVAIF